MMNFVISDLNFTIKNQHQQFSEITHFVSFIFHKKVIQIQALCDKDVQF